ncbi:hypothetical protein J4218_02395 [Candidatus Pacearchaeota archaeon]|nr:hypothetical protein [Candidatus Pacearchaeota archaeon]
MNLLKIALIISILGIIILLIISLYQKPELIQIKDLNKNLISQRIKVSGEIIQIRNFDNFQIITINDSTGKLLIINNKKQNISKNQKIIIIGKVQEYNNTLEIISERLYIATLKLS